MNNFIFERHVKIYFGANSVTSHLKRLLSNYGNNVLLAYGGGSIKRNGIYDELMAVLIDAGKNVTEFSGIMSNPTYQKVAEGAQLVKKYQIDLILAVGGGSVIDCCKIVSAQANADQNIWDLQVKNNTIPTNFVPLGVVLTASGTGSEMNAYAVITNEAEKIKGVLIGPYPDFSILDPKYTLTLPMKQVLSGAFDTLSHCMETYFGMPMENNLSDDMNEAVMRNVIRNISAVTKDPQYLTVRSELMWASSMAENSILKLGKTMAFQVHQIEHQLAAYTDCNHGLGLAVIHPVFYRRVYEGGIERFARFAVNVWGISENGKTSQELAEAGIEALADFIKAVNLPTTFRELGIPDETDYRRIADSCNLTPGGCFRPVSHDDIFEILTACH